MNKQSKEALVAEFAEKLKEAKAAFLADYRGLDVDQANDLRNKLREAGVEYRVVKNTLLRLAAKDTGAACFDEYLSGPTAIAVANEDPVAPAKALVEFAKKNEAFELKVGMLDGKLLAVADIKALAELPPRDILLSQVVAAVEAPFAELVGSLDGFFRELVGSIDALEEKKKAE